MYCESLFFIFKLLLVSVFWAIGRKAIALCFSVWMQKHWIDYNCWLQKKKRCFCLSFGKCNCEFYRVLFSSDSHNLAFPGNYNLLFNNTLLINFVVQTIDEPYVLVSFSTPLQHYTFQKALHSIRFINMVSEQLFLLEFWICT